MNLIRIYGLFLRHFYLITRSFPRILDLIYWPSIQITLWGFISNFFAAHSSYYSGAVGVILSCAILYDFLFRTSIGFNMLFLEEIWSRNFTNLFIAPMKISEIITSLVVTALINDPTVLLLDEPTASLDPETGDFVRSFLEDYKKEKKISVLLASHNMEEVKRLCSTVLMMKDGMIVDKGSPENLIKKYGRKNLEEVFLEIARKEK